VWRSLWGKVTRKEFIMSSNFGRFRLLVFLFASIAVLATFACSDDDEPIVAPPAPPPHVDLFSGAYAMEN
jgi:hypothetical protein